MKEIFIYSLMLFCINMFSQNAIKFDYDAGGNMTQRYIQVISMRLANKSVTKDTLAFKIYPNPTKDYITIEGALDEKSKEAQVFLYNINGSIVQQDSYSGTKKNIPLSGYTTGVYFLEIKYSKKQSNKYKILITE